MNDEARLLERQLLHLRIATAAVSGYLPRPWANLMDASERLGVAHARSAILRAIALHHEQSGCGENCEHVESLPKD